jgi:protein-S-isoprenylcysteine O-methyltransferase Ste14
MTGWLHAVGVVLAVAGAGTTVWAQLDMGDSWRIGVDPNETTDLVTGGVYRAVRNPIFTAMVAATIGLALMVPSWISIAAVGVLVAALEVQVRIVEEPYLATVHGDTYASYRRSAGRFLPGIGTR